jgi:AhpD family alkylhydroperoxidase
MEKMPKNFQRIQERYGDLIDKAKALGEAASAAGPLEAKTGHLIQLAAAAALRSEGAVHSHVRRALDAGASPEEIRHAVVLLTPTIGFPTVAAALSWIEDITG